ncbi:MAG: M50 family metallopeptidase, partial [Telluria sp.]
AVYLAGPMPGLMLALVTIGWMVLGHADPHARWYATLVTATGAAFLVNFLNLLPIMPLDGGRVVDLFVMARLPWFRFVFALGSGAALVWAGFETGDNVLRGLGFLAFVSVRHQYRMARVSRHLLKQTVEAPLTREDFPVAAARLFDFLAQPAYKKWTFEEKFGVGHYILPRFLGRLPNVKESLFGVFIYIACILGPLIALIAFSAIEPKRFAALSPFGSDTGETVSQAKAAAGPDPYQAWLAAGQARLAAAPAAARIGILGELIDDADEEEYYKDELRLARMLYAQTEALPAPAREHADAALRLASILWVEESDDNKALAARLRGEAKANLRLRLSRKGDSKDADLLVWALNSSVLRTDKAAMLAIRQEIVNLRAAPWASSGDSLPMARIALAHALDEDGQAAAAEDQLRTAAADLQGLPSAPPHRINMLALDHAWFLMAHQRPQEALARVGAHLKRAKDDPVAYARGERDVHLLAAVAARMRGDWREVRALALPVQAFANKTTGNWVADYFRPVRADMRVTLMLVEAERKLGDAGSADEHVAQLRKQYPAKSKGPVLCRFGREQDAWRRELAAALAEIEHRELHCTPAPPR